MSFSVHSIYQQVFKLWREKRIALFLERLRPRQSDVMLDVGGYPDVWVSRPQPVARIDTLNLYPVEWNPSVFPSHSMRTLVGDARHLSFPDRSYDIVFSNSVIEHVGGWESQKAFASEVRRVGKALWIQTPAFECPVEPHYMAFFIHWLPQGIQRVVVRWLTPWGWIERPVRKEIGRMISNTRLLKKRELKELFPDCEILTERLLGVLPKSYIAVRKDDPAPAR